MRSNVRVRLLLTTTFLVGFGPFVCNDSQVETAREQLRQAEAESALTTLAEVDDDAAEVHLVRGLAKLAQEKLEEAKKDLDQAYRRLAEVDALAAAERPEGMPEPPPAARPTAALRGRIAFALGLVALAEERWEDAMVEFERVLSLDPTDEDARWNMELAWHQANPPCHKRDDDHEPDNGRSEAKPYDPEKSTDRVLCPANEDWYVVEGRQEAILFVTLEGEIDTADDETREVVLELEGPYPGAQRRAPMVDGRATVGITGLRQAGQYFISVSGLGTAEVKYSLKVEEVPPCPADDAAEENDSAAEAHALEDGEKGGLKACPGDPDWYRVKAPADETRQIQIAFDPARGPLEATLFATDGETPIAVAKGGKGGLSVSLTKKETEQTALLRVTNADQRENTYALKVSPPEDSGDDQQDQQDQQDQDEQQDDKDQENQEDQKEQQEPPEQQEMNVDQLIDALDKQERNPQLEKAIRDLRVVPQMEDY